MLPSIKPKHGKKIINSSTESVWNLDEKVNTIPKGNNRMIHVIICLKIRSIALTKAKNISFFAVGKNAAELPIKKETGINCNIAALPKDVKIFFVKII